MIDFTTGEKQAGCDEPGQQRGLTTNPAYMHPLDIDGLGLAAGDLVEIRSPHAGIRGIVEADANLRRGLVSMTHSWGDAPDRDGLKATPKGLAGTLERGAHGETLRIHVFRRDELHAFEVRPAEPVADVCRMTLLDAAPVEAASRRAAWLAMP